MIRLVNVGSDSGNLSGLEADIDAVEAGLSQEIVDRTAGDAAVQANLDTEEAARIAADDTLDVRLVDAEENLAFSIAHIFEDNSTVYADAKPGVQDPSSLIRDGWYYTNENAGDKINWYFYDGTSTNTVAVDDLTSYALITLDSLSSTPFMVVYTRPTGTGDILPGFAHSSRVYMIPAGSMEVGKQYLVHVGEDPNIHKDLPRVELVAGTTVGDFDGSQIVMTSSLHTNSAASVGAVQMVVEGLGVSSASYKQHFDLRIKVASQLSLDAEEAARIAADTLLSNRLDSIEALESEEVFNYNTLASFPVLGEFSKIYIAEDENKIYHWKSVVGTETFDHTVGSGGDFATLSEALADANVVNGSKIKILNGTYDLTEQLVIDKEVQIFGESKDGVILQSSADTAAPTILISVTANNVALVDLTIKHRKTNNTSIETAVSASGGGFPQTRVDGFIISNCRIEHVEFGVVVRGSNYAIVDCEIAYEGPSNSTRRAIGLYGNSGESFVLRNTFLNNLSSGNLRAITLTSTTGSNPNETYEGTLVIEDNMHTGALQQFISMDAFQEGAEKFNLFVKRNTTNETSAFVSLYSGTANFADLFSKIVVEANNISNVHSSSEGTGKGLIGIDGWGADVDISTNPLPIESLNNILSQLNFRSDYQEIAGSSGSIVGAKIGAIVGDVSLTSVISATPSEPSYPTLSAGSVASYVELSAAQDLIQDLVTRETPSGTLDGANALFTLSSAPIVGSEHVYINGMLKEPGAGEDYVISDASITFTTAPASVDKIRVSYIKQT